MNYGMKYEWFKLINLDKFARIQIKFWELNGRILYIRVNSRKGTAYMTGEIRKKCNIEGSISYVPYGVSNLHYFIRNFWSYGLKDVTLIDNEGKEYHYKYKLNEFLPKEKLTRENWVVNLQQLNSLSFQMQNGLWINLKRTGAIFREINSNQIIHIRDVLNLARIAKRVSMVDNDGYYSSFILN